MMQRSSWQLMRWSCSRACHSTHGWPVSCVRLRGEPLSAARSRWMVTMSSQDGFHFASFPIQRSEVFAETELAFAFVNLKPIVPGHVLVSPKRIAPRFADLGHDEVSDLWNLAQKVGAVLEKHYGASSLTYAIQLGWACGRSQDGPAAGQTVPHVHIHVLPRKSGDFEQNDEVYAAIEQNEVDIARAPPQKLDLDKERTVRTPEEMAEEASALRQLF